MIPRNPSQPALDPRQRAMMLKQQMRPGNPALAPNSTGILSRQPNPIPAATKQYTGALEDMKPKQSIGSMLGSALLPMAVGGLAGGGFKDSVLFGIGSAASNYSRNKEMVRGIDEKIAMANYGSPMLEQDWEAGEIDANTARLKMRYPQYFVKGMDPGAVAKTIREIERITGAKPGTPKFDEGYSKYAASGDQRLYANLGQDPEYLQWVEYIKRSEGFGRESGKQDAIIAAIPEKVRAQYNADWGVGADKRIKAAMGQIVMIDSVLEEAKLALDYVGPWTTGMTGAIISKVAGTKAYALEAKVDTLKANLSFDKLAEMRANSPTGGALGNVSDRELKLLGSAVVALDAANTEEEVRRAIEKVLTHYNNWRGVVTGRIDADRLLTGAIDEIGATTKPEVTAADVIAEAEERARKGVGK